MIKFDNLHKIWYNIIGSTNILEEEVFQLKNITTKATLFGVIIAVLALVLLSGCSNARINNLGKLEKARQGELEEKAEMERMVQELFPGVREEFDIVNMELWDDGYFSVRAIARNTERMTINVRADVEEVTVYEVRENEIEDIEFDEVSGITHLVINPEKDHTFVVEVIGDDWEGCLDVDIP